MGTRDAQVNTIRGDSWCLYSSGYRRAADLLVDNVRSTLEVNTVVLPIVFLYRQFVELSLKEIIGYSLYLDGVQRGVPGTHDLKILWSEARAGFAKYLQYVPAVQIDKIEAVILEIQQIDPTSERSRYPFVHKRKFNPSVPSFSWESTSINLDELRNKMGVLAQFLDHTNRALAIAYDLEAEYREFSKP